jgi:hypothetical protein
MHSISYSIVASTRRKLNSAHFGTMFINIMMSFYTFDSREELLASCSRLPKCSVSYGNLPRARGGLSILFRTFHSPDLGGTLTTFGGWSPSHPTIGFSIHLSQLQQFPLYPVVWVIEWQFSLLVQLTTAKIFRKYERTLHDGEFGLHLFPQKKWE